MRKRRYAVAIGAVAGLALAGCAARAPSLADLPARELAGHYTSGPDGSWFRPCEPTPADASWWVTLTGRAVQQADSLRSAGQLVPGRRVLVRWRAAVTTGGEVGPQGPGVLALLVRDVLELRTATDGDCTTYPRGNP